MNANTLITYLHEDGSATRVVWDETGDTGDFVRDGDMAAVLVYDNDRDFSDPRNTDPRGMADEMHAAINHYDTYERYSYKVSRWERRRRTYSIEPYYLAERYLRIFHGCIAFDYRSTRDATLVGAVFASDEELDAEACLKGELDEYIAYLDGECYGILHAPADVVATTLDADTLEPDFDEIFDDVSVDAVWGFIGTDYARDAARGEFTNSPVKEEV